MQPFLWVPHLIGSFAIVLISHPGGSQLLGICCNAVNGILKAADSTQRDLSCACRTGDWAGFWGWKSPSRYGRLWRLWPIPVPKGVTQILLDGSGWSCPSQAELATASWGPGWPRRTWGPGGVDQNPIQGPNAILLPWLCMTHWHLWSHAPVP